MRVNCFLHYLSIALLVICGSGAVYQEAAAQINHVVTINGHTFSPATLTINVGDQVTWNWSGSFHDVTSGSSGTADGIFGSGIQNAGATFSVVFDRDFLRTNSAIVAPNGSGKSTFNYYCTPHYLMGMTGVITVQAQTATFTAVAEARQVVPASSSPDIGDFTFTLNANENQLTIAGTHSVTNATIDLIRGVAGTNGTTPIATIVSTASPVNSTISFSPALADDLYAGNLYVSIRSAQFPNGALRGQIVNSDSSSWNVQGQVRTAAFVGIPNVVISDGTHSVTTDEAGNYTLSGLTNGYYQLVASLSGYTITPEEGTNPVVIDSQNSFNRNFNAVGAIEEPPIILVSPANGAKLQSYDVQVVYQTRDNSSVSYLLDGKKGKQQFSSGQFSLQVDNGSHTLEIVTGTGTDVQTISHTFSVKSALTSANLVKAITLASKVKSSPTMTYLSQLNKLLLAMDQGGSMAPLAKTLKKSLVDRALAVGSKMEAIVKTNNAQKKSVSSVRVRLAPLGAKLLSILKAMR